MNILHADPFAEHEDLHASTLLVVPLRTPTEVDGTAFKPGKIDHLSPGVVISEAPVAVVKKHTTWISSLITCSKIKNQGFPASARVSFTIFPNLLNLLTEI